MSTDHKKTIDTLHELIQINREGERGYKEASENIDHPEFKTLLYRLSQQRALFRGELEDILHKDFKDSAEVKDSLASKAHRGWMDRLPDYIEKIALNQLEMIRGSLSQIREFKYEIQEA
jgi:uncharacterized protein (TIGR02284 family)